jgi:hypothetical protein
MTISDYQISSVIRTYVKNMRVRVSPDDKFSEGEQPKDAVLLSKEGMKKMLFARIGEKMTEKLKRHEPDE